MEHSTDIPSGFGGPFQPLIRVRSVSFSVVPSSLGLRAGQGRFGGVVGWDVVNTVRAGLVSWKQGLIIVCLTNSKLQTSNLLVSQV
jgi:hypothetical protein